ncbi:hypothetical protein C1I62_01160 [Streptococcus intermedius]|uniref:DUF1310 family protein n=1 Tax=Streptococcus intermedius TaxID=1338 RepID=UPI000C8463DF|nr:DUF1310 family protein [Streptococcus intermedius]PMR66761.1 hypothetical protein C1I62_01160 [Streptococcus intermedius]
MKKVLLILGAVLLGIVLVIGGCKVQGKSQKEQMLEIVKSEKVRVLIEDRLKSYDKRALTDNGIIKSYEIDEKTIKHNPMGGIDFTVYLNNNKDYYTHYRVEKSQTSDYYLGGGSKSVGLKKMLGEKLNE